MSRSLTWIVALIVVVASAVWLAGRDTAKPLTHIEKVIPDNALAH